jgi:hypothetical protein
MFVGFLFARHNQRGLPYRLATLGRLEMYSQDMLWADEFQKGGCAECSVCYNHLRLCLPPKGKVWSIKKALDIASTLHLLGVLIIELALDEPLGMKPDGEARSCSSFVEYNMSRLHRNARNRNVEFRVKQVPYRKGLT